MSAEVNITDHRQGDDCDYDFTVVDAQGAPEDITGWLFWFTLKTQLSDPDPGACQLTSAAGAIVIDIPTGGIGRIAFSATHTRDLEPGDYFFDFQCRKGSGGKLETLCGGTFTLLPQITRAE